MNAQPVVQPKSRMFPAFVVYFQARTRTSAPPSFLLFVKAFFLSPSSALQIAHRITDAQSTADVFPGATMDELASKTPTAKG